MGSVVVRVQDVMSSDVQTVDGMTTAKEAAEIMRSMKVSELLVSKRSEDDAWGIVSVSDLVREILVPGREAENVYIYEIMTKPVITVPSRMDIRYAIRLLHRIDIQRAPVEDMGQIVGMVTLQSLILDNDLL